MSDTLIFHVAKLIIAACMVLCAVRVWRETRETTWVLMVCVAVLWYAQILIDFLGAISLLAALPLVVRILIHVLPLVIFAIALLIAKPDRDLL